MEARLGAGGADSLADLYVRYVPQAFRLAYLLTGDRMLAEVIAHDAFVRLTGRFDHLRNPQALPGYLRKTVINLARNHFRHQRVERSYLEGAELSPEQAPVIDVAEVETVRAALLTLPYRQRAAIVLRYYEDLSEQETADLLGCRPGTVKSLISRGVGTLRVALGKDVAGER
jgi:RNA polymerase sigma-70 factor (sigma-E family)